MAKSDEAKSVESEEVIPVSESGVPPTGSGIEIGTEAKENPKRKSWMKNIGSGMRTLRLRKSHDKKSEAVLKDLAGGSGSMIEPEDEENAVPGNNKSEDLVPPQTPLPPTPTESSTADAVPTSPSSVKTLPKSKKKKKTDASPPLKSNTSRLSLREHVSKSKTKKKESAGLNGSVPREGSGNQKSGNGGSTKNESSDKADPSRFIGEGLSFKAKLIGILEVSGPRGDRICQEALSELKMAVKAAGEHKQKVTIHVALDGLRVRDEKTGDCLYHHQVHKISFIAQDLTDARAFGYIFGSPDTGHRFFGIKTDKSASQVVMSMRDLFQVVFDLKKKEIERAKQQLEMQQKFMATRAAETSTTRLQNSHKSGIAETYIDGACALGGPALPSATSGPAEADLLNLEVELTSLQEGLDNIHSTLIDTVTSHPTFNRGSTASISSDPMNPGAASFNKYSSALNSSSAQQTGAAPVPTIPIYTAANSSSAKATDPFGDSFDPYDSSKAVGSTIVSPSFPPDPFTQVDPFAGTKFAGGLESNDFSVTDPFETPVGGCLFTFPDSGRVVNRQISVTSNSSDVSSGIASAGPDLPISRPMTNSTLSSGHSPNLNKSDISNVSVSGHAPISWTASFEDNFASANGTDESKGVGGGIGTGDLFRDLDPLGTGRVRPFVDRKNFFQDLKNPSKKLLSELSAPPTSTVGAPIQLNSLIKPISQPEAFPSPLPNSFSTNFNPVSSTSETDLLAKPPSKSDVHLRTSSIRAELPGDTPPSYSPPPPPPQSVSSSSMVPSSVCFGNPPSTPDATPPTVKKSPQLLRNLTIASSAHGQSASPKTFPRAVVRLEKHNTVDSSSGRMEEIPSLTPPPRPPHTLGSSSILNRTSILPSALPRPHSGSDTKRQFSFTTTQSTKTASFPPEPPPRPISSSVEPILLPPPLPPKKQTSGSVFSNPLSRSGFNGGSVKSKTGTTVTPVESVWKFNDLPLPLPSRKTSNPNAQPRYAFPEEKSATRVQPSQSGRYAVSNENVTIPTPILPNPRVSSGLSMEAALNEVASLSLSQLAGKLQIPVVELSSCTIQELAMKLTMINLEEQKASSVGSMKGLATTFESDFGDVANDDFSTASAPAAFFPEEPAQNTQIKKIIQETQLSQPQYDRYAVFRELAESEGASGFSVCDLSQSRTDEEEDDEQKSRTLTSRGSSSEKTLQADSNAAGNELSTMDDITDANFSDGEGGGEESGLIDEVVELNLKAEWATFESNFDEQFVPLATGFNKSGESLWDSDLDNNQTKFGPADAMTAQLQQLPKCSPPAVNSHKDERSSQFDFQLFEKPVVSVDSQGRRNSRGTEIRGHHAMEPTSFHRQSSGSSKHSERSIGNVPISSRNVTTSDYSDSGKEKEMSYRNKHDNDRRRPDGRYRKNSREESDNGSSRRRTRRYYYDDDDEEGTCTPSPDENRRTRRRRFDDEECYSNASSRQSHSHSRQRHGHANKYYSHSLQRKDRVRDGRYGTSSRRPSESEKFSNHESDFDDERYDEGRRRGRGSGLGYGRNERDYRVSSRPASSGGSVSGSGGRNRKQRYRDSSREYYYHHYREHREPRQHGRERGYAYRRGRNRMEDEYENDGREISEYSGDEGRRGKRIRSRRRPERDRERDLSYYYTNSPSWESETPPSGKDEGDGSLEMARGTRLRRSDLDRPRERERDPRERDRPSSSSYHGDRLDGSNQKASRYKSDLSLSGNKFNAKLSASEFGFDADFSSSHPVEHFSQERKQPQPDQPRGQIQPPISKSLSQPESNSNKMAPNSSSSNKLSVEPYQQQPPPESPFEDNFVIQNNIFFPADFSSNPPKGENEESNIKEPNPNTINNRTSNQNGPESLSSHTSGSLEKSDENDSSSDPIAREESNNALQPSKETQIIQIVRKPIISDTIHEVPDNMEMKKSDSFNIFEQEKDPFADDDFFT